MIPQKYKVEGKEIKGVDVIAWLGDIQSCLNKMRENLAAAGGIIFKRPVDGVILQEGNLKAEISLFENNRKFSEVMVEIKDIEKQKLKVGELTEFVIYNLMVSPGPDGKLLFDPERQKQIIDAVEKRLKEKTPAPPKEEK